MMNLKLADWAHLAEITSGFAVVVSLVFLVVGIQENTAVTRASMYQQSTEQLLDFRNQTIADPEIARLFQSFLDGDYDDLDRLNELRLRQLILNAFSIYEQAFYAQKYGAMGPSEWSRFEAQSCRFYERAQPSSVFMDDAQLLLTGEFMTFLGKSCGE